MIDSILRGHYLYLIDEERKPVIRRFINVSRYGRVHSMPRGEPTHLHIFDFVELGNRSPSIRNYSSVEVVDRSREHRLPWYFVILWVQLWKSIQGKFINQALISVIYEITASLLFPLRLIFMDRSSMSFCTNINYFNLKVNGLGKIYCRRQNRMRQHLDWSHEFWLWLRG